MATNQPDSGHRRDLRLTNVPAIVDELTIVRRVVRRWAAAAELSGEQVQDLELAVYEALSNVLDHAYPARGGGVFDLHAVQDRDTVTVTVTDHGHWRQPADPASTLRGRGLRLIEKLATDFELRPQLTGTVVWMRWSRHPAG